MKSPAFQFTDEEARQMVADFIEGNGSLSSQDWTRFIPARS
jgi:hypothetical protein